MSRTNPFNAITLNGEGTFRGVTLALPPEQVHRMLPAGLERTRHEIALQLSLGATMGMLKGFGAPEVVHVYTRARTLCQEIGDTIQLFDALSGLEAIAFAKSDLRRARDLGHECLALAESL